jgi:hypothetical protein
VQEEEQGAQDQERRPDGDGRMKEEIEMVRERESLELLQSESLESVTNISGILSLLALPELPQDDPIFEH